MAVLAPMPRPRMRTAAAVKRQSRTRRRMAWRVSRSSASMAAVPRASRHTSLICSTPPNARSACCRAASAGMPLARSRSVSRSMCSCSSSLQLRFASIAEDERPQRGCRRMCQSRIVYVLSSTRLTPADSRSHFDTSVASCFRPARVSE